ncbi:hypothetical protein [Tsukamurella sp. NPDC003166]|uniref:hypothetical protein n=1 Tax=Tsukamurella sp. NPDC003166 TaxID=3154444 RepID=UPI0033ABD033
MTPRPVMLTDDEARVLREVWPLTLGHIIANPADGIQSLRNSCAHSGGGGWQRWIQGNRIHIEHHEWLPDVLADTCPDWCNDPEFWHTPDGKHINRWRRGDVLFEGSITLPRVQRWAESLPAELRARALVAWRTWPENTRDLDELARIVREALDAHCGAPAELTHYAGQIVGQEALW